MLNRNYPCSHNELCTPLTITGTKQEKLNTESEGLTLLSVLSRLFGHLWAELGEIS